MSSVKSIRALQRGLDVLKCLEDASPQSLHGLAQRCGLPKATLLRILQTLEQQGFVRRGLADQLYRINLRSIATPVDGWKVIVAEIAGNVLDQLCQKVSWPSDIGVYEDGSIIILETSRRQSPFLLNRDVLSRKVSVLASAMGRAYLAWSSEQMRNQILADVARSSDPFDGQFIRNGRVDPLISSTLAHGYAIREPGYSVSSTREAKISAIALPVIVAGRPLGAVNLAWVSSAMDESEFARQYLPLLQRAALRIGTALAERLPNTLSLGI